MEKKKKDSYLLRNNLVSKNKTGGITLIALVITIIVLLILAAVSIATLTGDNGILTKAQNASKKTKEETEKEQIKVAYDAALTDKMIEGKKEVTAEELEKELQKIEPEATAKGGTNEGEIEVTFPSGNKYTLESNGKITGPTNDESGSSGGGSTEQGVVPEFNVEVGEYVSGSGVTITVEVTNDIGQVDSITITNLDTGETYNAEISGKTGSAQVEKNGTYKVEVKATTNGVQKTGEKTELVNKIPVEFTTAQGRIDIIWVNTSNERIESPLAPVLNGMKKVYWKEDGTEVTEDGDFTESEWYNYQEGKGLEDNTSSKWANAINTTTIEDTSYDSYFVWIPRYAYRIIYYEDKECTKVAGYCDGDGIRDIAGNKKPETQDVKKDKGIETVEYNGFKYIVHPAFEGNIENGGWKDEEKKVEDLAGIWVGKYESAKSTANSENSSTYGGEGTNIKIVPNVTSWRNISIGTMYTNAYNYARDKESHLMKNSEWGAVSYLTHSQYGRNGHEVSINRCSEYITGMGSGPNTSTYKYSEVEENQRYNGENGKLASSTGNIYGVYDLSGGAYEYVAAFNEQDTNDYATKYGNEDFPGADKKSTKYATKYSSTSSTPSYDSYILGDATYEIYVGSSKSWLGDAGYVVSSSNPFFIRGGTCSYGASAGVFCSKYEDGTAYMGNYSFRVVLPGEEKKN